ncbi:SGNH/GDSL hydrolase family protein [Myxococcota bacterium]|nr:SGNH/GDSL hydrolase family protein [Myxococcota bacterium]
MSRRNRRVRRWFVLGGILAGLLLAEVVLRALYDALPSRVGLRGEGAPPRDPRTTPRLSAVERALAVCQEPWRPPTATRSTWPGSPDLPPLRLWTTGDSMKAGWGVQPYESFASLLAEQVARQTGAPVELHNLGQPGLGACGQVHMIEAALATRPAPSLVVAQLFSDDLHSHQIVKVGDRAVGTPPRASRNPLHALARHSYAANLTWLAWSLHSRHGPLRFTDKTTRAWFVARISALQASARDQGVPLRIVLMAPTGMPACGHEGMAKSCRTIVEDGGRLAEWLDEAGVPFLDLRAHWATRGPMVLASEAERALDDPRFLAIHPSPEGHRSLAEALLPTALQALAPAARLPAPTEPVAAH